MLPLNIFHTLLYISIVNFKQVNAGWETSSFLKFLGGTVTDHRREKFKPIVSKLIKYFYCHKTWVQTFS